MPRIQPAAGFLMLVAVATIATGARPAASAPILWPQNGHYYELVTTPRTWPAACAAARAARHGGWPGHLASIGSADENAFIVATVIGSPFPDPWSHVWVGGFQPPGSGEPGAGWGWSTGEVWSYANFTSPEPNNGWDGRGEEDGLAVTGNGPGLWNDICATQCHPYVVEYEDLPEGTCPSVTGTCLDMGLGCPPSPQCSDGMDNDSDGCIDFPCDAGCASADDGSEAGAGCATAARSEPPAFFGANGHYYESVPGMMTWTAARDAARTFSYLGHTGHLASVTSAEENEFLRQVGGANHWLGGQQDSGAPSPSDGWRWVDGATWGYTHWATGEPNNSNHVDENYLEFKDGAGGWNDVPATDPNPAYLVEYDVGQPLAAPTGVGATDDRLDGVWVSWTPGVDAVRYRVLRNGTVVHEVPAFTTSVRDVPIPGMSFLYCVEAVNACGAGSARSCDTGTWSLPRSGGKVIGDVDEPLLLPVPRTRFARPAVIVAMAAPGHVRIDVFDVAGRRVGTLAERTLPAGRSLLEWDARRSDGAPAGAGVYFARLAVGASRAGVPLILAP